MKQVFKIYTTIMVLCFASISIIAQCDLELQEQIESEIKKDKVEFLKGFSVELGAEEDKAKYSMVLSEGHWYRFYIYESDKYRGEGHFEMGVDSKIIGTNLNKGTGKKYHYFDFKCTETMEYDITVYNDGGEKYCSELVLVFVSKFGKDEHKESEILKEVDKDVFMVVDKMPQFIDGNASSGSDFREWMNKHLQYPEEAIKQKIEGKVFVQFVVSSTGKVQDVKVVRGVDPVLDRYAVELVEASPKWAKPGYIDGVAVNVIYTFPVSFKL